MKKTRIIIGIICLVIDIIICAVVCWQWSQVQCNHWSLAAAVLFYTIGCWGLYIFMMEVIDFVCRLINCGKYPKNPTIR